MERHGVPVINRETLKLAFDQGALATVVYRRGGNSNELSGINSERSIALEIDERKEVAKLAAGVLGKPLSEEEPDDFTYLCARLRDFGSSAEVKLKAPIGKLGQTCFVDLNDNSPATPEVIGLS